MVPVVASPYLISLHQLVTKLAAEPDVTGDLLELILRVASRLPCLCQGCLEKARGEVDESELPF